MSCEDWPFRAAKFTKNLHEIKRVYPVEMLQTKEEHAGELLRWNVSTLRPHYSADVKRNLADPSRCCPAISESSADLLESYNLLQRSPVSPTAGLWLFDANVPK